MVFFGIFFFFFNDTPTTEIYTLSLHDALPILLALGRANRHGRYFFHRLLNFVAAAPCLIYEHVMHDREQPRPQIASRAPKIELVPGALQGVLNQVVRDVAVAHERAGVAPQPGDVLDDESTIHLLRILARGRLFRERFARWEPRGYARTPSLPGEGCRLYSLPSPKKENLRYKRAAWRIYSAGCGSLRGILPGAAWVNTRPAPAIPVREARFRRAGNERGWLRHPRLRSLQREDHPRRPAM